MQCWLGDFTHRIPWQSIDNLQCFGNFVGRHFSFTPVFQLFIVEAGGRFECDECSHGFSPGVVCNADNGPMAHNPPPGLGMTETIFRGGKGDFLEGGVRVPAFAWWPGVVEAGQLVGDIVHETDLYTTFARLAESKDAIPTDRIVMVWTRRHYC